MHRCLSNFILTVDFRQCFFLFLEHLQQMLSLTAKACKLALKLYWAYVTKKFLCENSIYSLESTFVTGMSPLCEDKPYISFQLVSSIEWKPLSFEKKAAFVVLNGEMKLSKRVTFSRNESTELMVSPSRHQTARMHVLLVDNHPDANRQTTCVIFRLVLIFTNYDAMLYMSFRRHIVSKINSFLISAKEKAL